MLVSILLYTINFYKKYILHAMNLTHFFLGLLEGDGSLQVNHWKKRILQFRIVIKLKNTPQNYHMLVQLREHLQCMKVHVRHNYVLLIENDQKALRKLCAIFERFPFLTQAKRQQYAFFKYCFTHKPTISEYMYLKAEPWHLPEKIKQLHVDEILACAYYPSWLSGFIEAEGCFCVRKNNVQSFSIGQKNDPSIIGSVQKYFKFQNKIQEKKNKMYVLEGGHRQVLGGMIAFFEKYPLLGEKNVSFTRFVEIYTTPKE